MHYVYLLSFINSIKFKYVIWFGFVTFIFHVKSINIVIYDRLSINNLNVIVNQSCKKYNPVTPLIDWMTPSNLLQI